MAEILTSPVDPATLTEFINNYVQVPTGNKLTQLARIETTDSDHLAWSELARENRMAKFRPWDGSIARTARDLGEERRVPLAPFSLSDMNSEYDRYRKRFASLGVRPDDRSTVLEDAVLADGQRLTIAMWNRVEKALGDLVATGRFSVDENMTRYEVDYGLPAGNRVVAAVPWTDINALAADDLRAMRDQSIAAYGIAPGQIITSQRVLNALCRNVQVVSEYQGMFTGKIRLTNNELQSWLASENLPAVITQVDGVMTDDEDGTDRRVRVFPDDVIVLAPANLGDAVRFTFGMSVSAVDLRNAAHVQGNFGDDRIVGMILRDGPPFREYVYTDAVGIPALTAPKSIVIGEVL